MTPLTIKSPHEGDNLWRDPTGRAIMIGPAWVLCLAIRPQVEEMLLSAGACLEEAF